MNLETSDPASAVAAPRARPLRWWSRAAVLSTGSALIAGAGLLASTDLHGIPTPQATAPIVPAPPIAQRMRLADETPGPANAIEGAYRGSPESRLISIYQAIAANRTDAAIDAAAALTRDVPAFRLGQLVYADLLSARRGNEPRMAALARGDERDAELVQLRDEAVMRLKALRERPPVDRVPAEFVMLPKAVHHALLVDTSRARIYLFQNGAQGLKLVSDHYVSVGKQGVDKAVEGDQRTPLGVYFVSDRVAQGALEARFGAGALQLNYPNAFDRLHGRTGSGIYVHGVPTDTYSRPPHDSDGCVVMANDELLALMATIPVHDTPVVITRQVHWVTDDAAKARRKEILDAVVHWQGARSAHDSRALEAFYVDGARPVVPAAPIAARNARAARPRPPEPVAFADLSVMGWSEAHDTMVVTFREHGTRSGRDSVLRQYWARQDRRWAIVAEGQVR